MVELPVFGVISNVTIVTRLRSFLRFDIFTHHQARDGDVFVESERDAH